MIAFGHVAFGAGITVAAGAAGALAGAVVAPGGAAASLVGTVAAVAAAMAWVDRRIERRMREHEVVETARAEARDARLLLKVEEMLR